MKNIVLSFCVALAAGSIAAAKPEISWSIMHPTAIDIAYMKRVVAKAVEYGVWTVTVGKKGVDYPGVMSVACLP